MRLQVEAELLITTMTLGKVVKGIERLPMGQRRSELEHWYANDLRARFQGRIQSLDEAASYEWGAMRAAGNGWDAAACGGFANRGGLHPAGSCGGARNEADFVQSGVTGLKSLDLMVTDVL